jgi:hypothetical protein
LKDKDIIRDKTKKEFPFVTAENYRGSWLANLKDGFGILIKDTSRYEGEFKCDKRDGLGALWLRNDAPSKNTLKWCKVYEGGWKTGRKDGNGTYFYENGDVYKGEWFDNKRSGEGSMEYFNGDKFQGTYMNDKRNGPGTMLYLNGDVFRGHYAGDMKDGPGLHFYRDTVKVYEGEWLEDQPRCGELREPTAAELKHQYIDLGYPVVQKGFHLPPIELLKPHNVIAHAVADMRLHRSSTYSPNKTMESSVSAIDSATIQRAENMFNDLDQDGHGLIAAQDLLPVLFEMGVDASDDELAEVLTQIELTSASGISFPEAVDIANVIMMKSDMSLIDDREM